MVDRPFQLLATRTLHQGHVVRLTSERVALPFDANRPIEMDVVGRRSHAKSVRGLLQLQAAMASGALLSWSDAGQR